MIAYTDPYHRARLARIKQNQARIISDRAKPLGRKFFIPRTIAIIGYVIYLSLPPGHDVWGHGRPIQSTVLVTAIFHTARRKSMYTRACFFSSDSVDWAWICFHLALYKYPCKWKYVSWSYRCCCRLASMLCLRISEWTNLLAAYVIDS